MIKILRWKKQVAYINDTFRFSWSTAITFESGGANRLQEQFFNRGNSNKSCLQEKIRIKMFKRNKKDLSKCRKIYTAYLYEE